MIFDENPNNNKFFVCEKELSDLFIQEQVKDRKIALISIVGVFRAGKSFLLNYCLRYLYAHVSHSTMDLEHFQQNLPRSIYRSKIPTTS
jgi:predicted AAA+ superfamily ATPase